MPNIMTREDNEIEQVAKRLKVEILYGQALATLHS